MEKAKARSEVGEGGITNRKDSASGHHPKLAGAPSDVQPHSDAAVPGSHPMLSVGASRGFSLDV